MTYRETTDRKTQCSLDLDRKRCNRRPAGGLWALALLATLAVTAGLRIPTARADADDEAARRSFKIATAHYENGEFDAAAQRFSEAYVLSGGTRNELLYNIYLAYRDAQEHRHARDVLAAYLSRARRIENVALLRSRLTQLVATYGPARPFDAEAAARGKLSIESQQSPGQGAEPAQQEEAPPQQPASEARGHDSGPTRARSPIAGIVVLSLGAASLLGGGVMAALERGAESQLIDQCDAQNVCDASLRPVAERAKTYALLTDVLLGAGLVTAAIGVVLLLTSKSPPAEQAAEAPLARFGCGPTGCAGSVEVSF